MGRRNSHITVAFLFLILFFGVGCVKEQFDTIYPLEYFPVYPGSYWKFAGSNGDTITHSTDPEYKLHSYGTYSSSENSPEVYVPFYNDTPIYGYYEHVGRSGYSNQGLKMILSETVSVGTSWRVYQNQGTGVSRRIIARDTTITTSMGTFYPVIVVDTFISPGPSFYLGTKNYYAKDVGIIRMDVVSDEGAAPNIFELIAYNINR